MLHLNVTLGTAINHKAFKKFKKFCTKTNELKSCKNVLTSCIRTTLVYILYYRQFKKVQENVLKDQCTKNHTYEIVN